MDNGNGPDSDPDMVGVLFLVFDAAALEAAGDYHAAFELLEDAADADTECTSAVVDSARELTAYTVDLWAEAGASAKDLKHVNKHLARGDKHLAKGKIDNALREYGRALDHAVEGLDEG